LRLDHRALKTASSYMMKVKWSIPDSHLLPQPVLWAPFYFGNFSQVPPEAWLPLSVVRLRYRLAMPNGTKRSEGLRCAFGFGGLFLPSHHYFFVHRSLFFFFCPPVEGLPKRDHSFVRTCDCYLPPPPVLSVAAFAHLRRGKSFP